MTTKPNHTAESEPKSGNGLCRELDTLRSRVEELESRLAVAAESIQFWPDSAHHTARLAGALRCELPKVVFERWWRDAVAARDWHHKRVRSAEAETTRIGRELLRLREQPTLRDQLAMAVLPQLMAQCDHYYDTHPGAATVTRDDTCGEAYRWADAMMLAKGWTLKARNQQPAESK